MSIFHCHHACVAWLGCGHRALALLCAGSCSCQSKRICCTSCIRSTLHASHASPCQIWCRLLRASPDQCCCMTGRTTVCMTGNPIGRGRRQPCWHSTHDTRAPRRPNSPGGADLRHTSRVESQGGGTHTEFGGGFTSGTAETQRVLRLQKKFVVCMYDNCYRGARRAHTCHQGTSLGHLGYSCPSVSRGCMFLSHA